MKAKLTDLSITKLALKPNRYTVWDENLKGFGVRVYHGRTFVLKQANHWYTLGRYPIVTLKQARDEAKRRLALKYFPEPSIPVAQAIDEYMGAKSHRRPKTQAVFGSYLKRLPQKPLNQLTPQILYAALPDAKSAANLCFSVWRAFFSHCVERGYITTNPLQARRAPNKLTSRSRLLSDHEVQLLWNETYNHNSFGALLRLLFLSGQRLSQWAKFQPAWLNDDQITWPKEAMKGATEHTIPLAPLIRKELTNYTPPKSIAYDLKKLRAALPQVQDFRPHDARRYISSSMARIGIKQEVVEKILAHKTGKLSAIAAVYNRYDYASETRDAFELYHAHLARMLQTE